MDDNSGNTYEKIKDMFSLLGIFIYEWSTKPILYKWIMNEIIILMSNLRNLKLNFTLTLPIVILKNDGVYWRVYFYIGQKWEDNYCFNIITSICYNMKMKE